ncbi:coiled-coil protein [Arabidopsis thaliana]|uniref:Coiled-coil protein n=1 Tax=Arabidopsis thaliana TaxID=3702 RepID=A0A1P8ANI4_ARATH|nr:coiled-coil protein [Arabidopsis thaliana]ANM58211.1 coiled-coil protein [Arabidopsis thaliana]|eukprot:NP_001320664.1 coiled-coil protein [Arabidopsis thaliana]
MRRFLQRVPSLLARNILHSPANFRHLRINNPRVVVPLFERAISRFVFFSSESDSSRGFRTEEVLSKEELKKRIQSFLDDGNEDAIPDLFEALMIRKLSGKHDDSDDEVMDVVHIESDDLRDGDSSDSDVEFDGFNDVGLSDVNIKTDALKANRSSYSYSESD